MDDQHKANGDWAKGNRYGGRKKGSLNVATRLLRDLKLRGESPFAFLWREMHDEALDRADRRTAAITLMPYCHTRRKFETVPYDLPTPTSAAEATALLAALPVKVAAGDLDPALAESLAALLKAYIEAFTVSVLETKMKALIEARRGNVTDEGSFEFTPEELEARVLDLRPKESVE